MYENHSKSIFHLPKMVFEDEVKGRILIKCQLMSKLKEYTLIGMRRMAQRIPTTHATNAHLVCAYADTTSRTFRPAPRVPAASPMCACPEWSNVKFRVGIIAHTQTLYLP